MFLICQSKGDSGVFFLGFRFFVGIFFCSSFKFSPFPPEIKSAGVFEDIGDVCTADTGCDFDKYNSPFPPTLKTQRVRLRVCDQKL